MVARDSGCSRCWSVADAARCAGVERRSAGDTTVHRPPLSGCRRRWSAPVRCRRRTCRRGGRRPSAASCRRIAWVDPSRRGHAGQRAGRLSGAATGSQVAAQAAVAGGHAGRCRWRSRRRSVPRHSTRIVPRPVDAAATTVPGGRYRGRSTPLSTPSVGSAGRRQCQGPQRDGDGDPGPPPSVRDRWTANGRGARVVVGTHGISSWPVAAAFWSLLATTRAPVRRAVRASRNDPSPCRVTPLRRLGWAAVPVDWGVRTATRCGPSAGTVQGAVELPA